ncbi:leukocyte cysteine proteinase inhibitor 1-like [Heterodontus francisci]|uniref:leukocyte cysteine proteinase inhibitor 1-like n=1 Tax=Heterodontus francisci TaxID=7792 RepID=UPI00355AF932
MAGQQQLKVGGFGEEEAVSEELQKIVQELKQAVEQRLGKDLKTYHAISHRSQVVAGTKYFVKIVVGLGDEYIHISIIEPLPHTDEKPSLVNVKEDMRLFDKILPF